MKWNESGYRPPLCTYRLNWARRTSWGWWDDTVLQTQDSKFEPWWSEAEHATSRSERLPTILTFTRGWGETFCFFYTTETGNRAPPIYLYESLDEFMWFLLKIHCFVRFIILPLFSTRYFSQEITLGRDNRPCFPPLPFGQRGARQRGQVISIQKPYSMVR